MNYSVDTDSDEAGDVDDAATCRKTNLAHELGRFLLDYDFGYVLFDDRCRKMGPTVEEEALWLSGELLIPRAGALECARHRATDREVATQYEISEPSARMRMNWSGICKQAEREHRARNRP